MKIALAQINTTVGDFAGNIDRILKYAQCARERGADLVVFPELAICGYPPRDLVERPGFILKSESELARLVDLLPPIPTLVGSSGARKGGASAPPSMDARLEGPLGPEAKPLQGLKPRNCLARLAAGLKPRPSASDG